MVILYNDNGALSSSHTSHSVHLGKPQHTMVIIMLLTLVVIEYTIIRHGKLCSVPRQHGTDAPWYMVHGAPWHTMAISNCAKVCCSNNAFASWCTIIYHGVIMLYHGNNMVFLLEGVYHYHLCNCKQYNYYHHYYHLRFQSTITTTSATSTSTTKLLSLPAAHQ